MASIKQNVQEQLNNMQMEIIKQAQNIDEVKQLIDVFSEMNQVAEKLSTEDKPNKGGKRTGAGRKPKTFPQDHELKNSDLGGATED